MDIAFFTFLVFVFFSLGLILGGSLASGGNRERELIAYNKGYERCKRDYNLYHIEDAYPSGESDFPSWKN